MRHCFTSLHTFPLSFDLWLFLRGDAVSAAGQMKFFIVKVKVDEFTKIQIPMCAQNDRFKPRSERIHVPQRVGRL